MAKVIILRGLPGSGKSTFLENVIKAIYQNVVVCSADHYFIDPDDGVYRFEPHKLSWAHQLCQRDFYTCLMAYAEVGEEVVVVVDNTNTSLFDFGDYCDLAIAHGAELEIVTFMVPPEIAYGRNVHSVPWHTIQRMQDKLRRGTLDLPEHWNHTFLIQ